jgi:hypothetical protein
MRAGFSPAVGSKVALSLSIPFMDLSTGSGFPVADDVEDGATAEKADTGLVSEARTIAAEKNFILLVEDTQYMYAVMQVSGILLKNGCCYCDLTTKNVFVVLCLPLCVLISSKKSR